MGCSLSWNSQNYHFPSFSGAGAGAQNSMECANAQNRPWRRYMYLYPYSQEFNLSNLISVLLPTQAHHHPCVFMVGLLLFLHEIMKCLLISNCISSS